MITEDLQNELINIRHATTAGRFRIGEIANSIFERRILSADGIPFEYVASAVGNIAGVSTTTVIKYARIERQAGKLYREEGYEALSFSQFAAALTAGPQMVDVLDYAAENPAVSIANLRHYASDMLRPVEEEAPQAQPDPTVYEGELPRGPSRPLPDFEESDLLFELANLEHKIDRLASTAGRSNPAYRKLVAARHLVASAIVELSIRDVPKIVNTLLIDQGE